jgi:mannosyltransferase OCH1-like enzyme
MRMATTNKAGTRKKNYHFQISHLGQMLNEWKILEKVRADSTITSSSRDLAAIYFNEAKRVLNEAAGDLAKPPQHGTHQVIPRQIWQYWNTPEMPDEIELAIDSWRGQAGWKHRRLTHSDAVAWLRDAFDEEHARAFQLANHIAEGADFLRLCLLLAEGGIYADADDKRTGCLDALVAESSGVLLFREANGAISNNFICAAPGHPVMARAVNMARNSLLRRENDSTWSKTGPGLLTRAAALHFIDDPDAAIRDTRILRQNLSRRFVHPHLAIAYKSTPSYWNAQSDEISARMRLALINLVRSKGCTANFGVA